MAQQPETVSVRDSMLKGSKVPANLRSQLVYVAECRLLDSPPPGLDVGDLDEFRLVPDGSGWGTSEGASFLIDKQGGMLHSRLTKMLSDGTRFMLVD
jgi:hypothetical protein